MRLRATASRVGRLLSHLAIAAALAGVATYLVMLIVPARSSMEAFHVLSGSMEPSHAVGTTLLVQEHIDRLQVSQGQVITFLAADGAPPVTHRVVEIFTDDAGQQWYVTQGDANEDPDPEPVHPANLVGVVETDLDHLLTVPVLGELPLGQRVTWTRTVPGMAVLFGPVLVFLVLGELRVMFTGIRLPGRRRGKHDATAPAADTTVTEPAAGAASDPQAEHREPVEDLADAA